MKNIVLVSKNKTRSNSFVHDLQQEGFKVQVLRKSNEVQVFLYNNPEFCMVILDLESLKKNADDLIAQIKNDPQLKYTPIICIIKKICLLNS